MKVKIKLDDITYGPKDPDEFDVEIYAYELTKQGYRKTSNAYCMVSRIDRDDWLQVLAKQLHCAVADFYMLDGSGISNSWKDFYVRTHSKDKHTVHPKILQKMKAWN